MRKKRVVKVITGESTSVHFSRKTKIQKGSYKGKSGVRQAALAQEFNEYLCENCTADFYYALFNAMRKSMNQ